MSARTVPPGRDVLAAIDATVDGLCACGCGTPLDPQGPSGWYVNEYHQRAAVRRTATDPAAVESRPDAARVLVGADGTAVPISDPDDQAQGAGGLARLTAEFTGIPIPADGFVGVTRRTVERLDPPPLPTSYDRNLWDRAAAEPAWSHADRAGCPVRWLRLCPGCGDVVTPRTGVPPRRFELASPVGDPTVVEMPEVRNWCPGCREPFPGPPLLAQWRDEVQRGGYRLRLGVWSGRVGGTVEGFIDDRSASAAPISETVWRELGRAVDEALVFRHGCAVAGCSEKGRALFRWHRSATFDLTDVGSRQGFDRGDHWLCPRHESNLLRAVDDAGVPLVGFPVPWPQRSPGIVTALPSPAPTGGDPWQSMLRLYEQVRAASSYRPGPVRLEVDEAAREQLDLLVPAQSPAWPDRSGAWSFAGLPVGVNDALPLGGWRLLAADGSVLHEGRLGVAVSVPPTGGV